MNNKIVEMVANKLKAIMDSDRKLPWLNPWNKTVLTQAVSYSTQKPYSLLNQLLLDEQGEFITFNQIRQAKGVLNAGAKAKQILFYSFIEQKDENGEVERRIPFMRYYNVFSLKDTKGIESKFENAFNKSNKRIENIDEVINNYAEKYGLKMELDEYNNTATYNFMTDVVKLPALKQFKDEKHYYNTLFHELIHSTCHETRLNRKVSNNFKTDDYSLEEMVAEIGASILMNTFGIENDETLLNSATYIKSWQKRLEEKPENFITACNRAEKAVNMILGNN